MTQSLFMSQLKRNGERAVRAGGAGGYVGACGIGGGFMGRYWSCRGSSRSMWRRGRARR